MEGRELWLHRGETQPGEKLPLSPRSAGPMDVGGCTARTGGCSAKAPGEKSGGPRRDRSSDTAPCSVNSWSDPKPGVPFYSLVLVKRSGCEGTG